VAKDKDPNERLEADLAKRGWRLVYAREAEVAVTRPGHYRAIREEPADQSVWVSSSDPGKLSERIDRREADLEAARTQALEDVEATPAAEEKAEELGVDLADVEGTGQGGRITVSDVKFFDR
jgi:pyruvate/2-oxoglutarate dehydrogenase complex dihydrolipoamide acyltransferase (E2) component